MMCPTAPCRARTSRPRCSSRPSTTPWCSRTCHAGRTRDRSGTRRRLPPPCRTRSRSASRTARTRRCCCNSRRGSGSRRRRGRRWHRAPGHRHHRGWCWVTCSCCPSCCHRSWSRCLLRLRRRCRGRSRRATGRAVRLARAPARSRPRSTRGCRLRQQGMCGRRACRALAANESPATKPTVDTAARCAARRPRDAPICPQDHPTRIHATTRAGPPSVLTEARRPIHAAHAAVIAAGQPEPAGLYPF